MDVNESNLHRMSIEFISFRIRENGSIHFIGKNDNLDKHTLEMIKEDIFLEASLIGKGIYSAWYLLSHHTDDDGVNTWGWFEIEETRYDLEAPNSELLKYAIERREFERKERRGENDALFEW